MAWKNTTEKTEIQKRVIERPKNRTADRSKTGKCPGYMETPADCGSRPEDPLTSGSAIWIF